MKLIHPRLVLLEENDNAISVKAWLIKHTACTYKDFDTEHDWVINPDPGDVLVLPKAVITDPEVMLWKYPYQEKGEENPDTKVEQLRQLLVHEFGEEGAKNVIERLAFETRQASFQQFYQGGRVKLPDIATRDTLTETPAVWGYQDDTTKK